MNDHIKSEISSYLAGGLPESRNRQIEAHAAACEKCRNALSKARAKQARVKREALKKASADQIPNFFWARQNKSEGVAGPSSSKVWVMAGVILIAGGGYWAYVRSNAVQRNVVTPNAVKPNTVQPNDVQQNVAHPPPPPPATPPKPAPAETDTPPVVLHVQESWKGADSGVTESRLVVIRNADAWGKLWSEMATKEALPSVDFEKAVVLAVFAGAEPAGSSIIFGRIDEGDQEVSAPYRIVVPDAPAAVPGSSATAPAVPAASHPYLLVTIPRVNKKIRLTQREKRT